MRLMICIPQLVKGGAERVACNLSNYFIEKNDVSLVSLRNYSIEYDLNKNIEVFYLDKDNKQNKVLKAFNRIIKMYKLIKDIRPDLVLCFLPESSFVMLILRMLYKGKIVVSVRNDPKVEYKNYVKKFLMKILYPFADGFVFQTEEAQNYFSDKIKKKSKIIYNSLNPSFLVPKFNGIRKKRIVAVGRLTKQKNHKLLIKAFSNFCKKNNEYMLYIYGNGIMKEELIEYTKKLNIDDKVVFPGVVDNVKDEIYDASLYVLSSNYEGMPNSLMEALSLGIPCISTNCPCGGPKALIKNNYNGILIDVNDEDTLSQKIEKILFDKEFSEDLAQKANNDMKKFDPIIINKIWDDYLNEILEKR